MTAELDEPNDARMAFRTKARIKTAIQSAAALSGVDDPAFPATTPDRMWQELRLARAAPAVDCEQLMRLAWQSRHGRGGSGSATGAVDRP